MLASERVAEGAPLYVGIGTPSRGVAGDVAQRRQHLTFWEIEPADVGKLRATSVACDISNYYKGQEIPEQIQVLIDAVWETLFSWRNKARLRWCHVIENRPEIVTPRDEGTAMEWFRDKRVALWGCGAIGGLIAEHLARAGVAQLTLYDRARVTPGVLARQNFCAIDTNDTKAAALARRVESISPGVAVATRVENIITDTLTRTDWDADIDLVIDATASLRVRSKLEAVHKEHDRHAPVASVMISAAAKYAVAVVAPHAYRAGPFDVLRRLGLAAVNRHWLSEWAKAFWTSDAIEGLRQPEPGCSDPTFVASHADVAGLSARALNALAEALVHPGDSASGFLISQSTDDREHRFRFRPDIRWVADGIDFRMSANAWRDMSGWIRAGSRERSVEHETGGLLFGEFDETLGIAWVTNVSGPPRDSSFSAQRFVCGTHGTRELSNDYEERTHRIVRYVGTWHSHPVSAAAPSKTDYEGIGTMFASAPDDGAHQLMVIVGHAADPQPQLGAYAFEKQALAAHRTGMKIAIEVRGGTTTPPPVPALDKRIGLSLSGGGSRAVAFHLGTLRALEDLKLLDEVDVISGVSGGSVMTGLLGYSEAPFSKIDRAAVEFLGRGLVRLALKKFMHPARGAALLLEYDSCRSAILGDRLDHMDRQARRVTLSRDPPRLQRRFSLFVALPTPVFANTCHLRRYRRRGRHAELRRAYTPRQVNRLQRLRTPNRHGVPYEQRTLRHLEIRLGTCGRTPGRRRGDGVGRLSATPATVRLDAALRATRGDKDEPRHRDRRRCLREPRGQCDGAGSRFPNQRNHLQPRHHHRKRRWSRAVYRRDRAG